METFIKEVGLVCIGGASAEARETTMKSLSLDANKHLIDAAYAESLLPSVDEQIAQYEKIVADLHTQIADIEELASKAPNPQEGYNIRKDKKPLEAQIRSYEQGKNRMLERKAAALEKINAHRFDAQAIMHRIAFISELGETTLYDQLRSHIENQQAPEVSNDPDVLVVTEEVPAEPTPEPVEEVSVEETPAEETK